jgi:hypothetical protein
MLIDFLCSERVLSSLDFTVLQRAILFFDDGNTLHSLFQTSNNIDDNRDNDDDNDDADDASQIDEQSVGNVVSALIAAGQATFSPSTGEMARRAAVRVAQLSIDVAQWPPVEAIAKQRALDAAADAAAERAMATLRRTPRSDLHFMRLAWHRHLGVGALATVGLIFSLANSVVF